MIFPIYCVFSKDDSEKKQEKYNASKRLDSANFIDDGYESKAF
jgi:hypothetical protein